MLHETWKLGREHWGPLLFIGFVTLAPAVASSQLIRAFLDHATPRPVVPELLLLADFILDSWLSGIEWMAIGLVAAVAVQQRPVTGPGALRTCLPSSARCAVLMAIWHILFSMAAFAANLIVLPSVPGWLHEHLPWMSRTVAHHVSLQLVFWLYWLLIAPWGVFVAFAPFAVILEGEGGWGAVQASARLVLGNWRWVFVSLLMFLLVRRVLWIPFYWVPEGPAKEAARMLWNLVLPFVWAGNALLYLNLLARSGTPIRAGGGQPVAPGSGPPLPRMT